MGARGRVGSGGGGGGGGGLILKEYESRAKRQGARPRPSRERGVNPAARPRRVLGKRAYGDVRSMGIIFEHGPFPRRLVVSDRFRRSGFIPPRVTTPNANAQQP